MHYNSLFIRHIKAWFFIVIKRALWLGKPQYSSDCPASRLSPPWEGSGEVMQVSTPLPWGGVGGGFLLFSFTKPFARQPVLRSKRITVGNTRVLSLFATHWLWGCYEKQGKIQRKIMAKSIAIYVILACVLLHFARWNDADERVIWRRLQDDKP